MSVKITLPKPLFSQKSKRAILLLHAYSGSSNDVRMLSRFLEKHDYTVYSPIFTGHGTLDPLDILSQNVAAWEADTQKALAFLKEQGYQQIAVFGLSMGGLYATKALEWQDPAIVGGGFFCSPLFPVATKVPENFLIYAENVLKTAGVTKEERAEKIEKYQSLVIEQLQAIEKVAADGAANLEKVTQPFFMAQAGQDEMIEPSGVFQTAAAMQGKRFVLQWYPESSHVITVGPARRQLEQDVVNFLTTLDWNEE